MNVQEYAKAANMHSLEQLLHSSYDGVMSLFDDQSSLDIEYYPMAFVDLDCVSILKYCSSPRTFEEIGYHCKAATKSAANYKYGENRSKLLFNLGLVDLDYSKSSCQVKTNHFGLLLTLFPKEDSVRLMIRLSVSIPLINRILTSSNHDSIDISQYFPPGFSYNTILRRSTSIIHLIKDICKEFKLYGFTFKRLASSDSEKKETNLDLYIEDLDEELESTVNHPVSLIDSTSKDTPDIPVVGDEDGSIPDTIQIMKEIESMSEPYDYFQSEDSHSCPFLSKDHILLQRISSFISNFYKIDKSSSIKHLFETLVNIIEDPNSNFLTQTIASVPLGYFVKYARLDSSSLKECEFACLYSLIKLSEVDMDLVILNLSSKFTLEQFYAARDSYYTVYSSVSSIVIDRLGLSSFISHCSNDLSSPSYYSELSTLYSSEANLYYRVIHSSTDSLSDKQILRVQQLLSQSRVIYPKDGLDIHYLPILEPISFIEDIECPLYSLIINSIPMDDKPDIVSLLNDLNTGWQENIIELLTLSYAVSPFRNIFADDSDIVYMLGVSIMDRLNSSTNPDDQAFSDELYYKISSLIPQEYDQVVLMNRVNLIVISNYLSFLGEVPMSDLIRSDNADITRICLRIDKSSGKNAKYKSRLGISSSLSAFEKMDVIELKKIRLLTDSPRSRQNRYMNRLRYDYDDQ